MKHLPKKLLLSIVLAIVSFLFLGCSSMPQDNSSTESMNNSLEDTPSVLADTEQKGEPKISPRQQNPFDDSIESYFIAHAMGSVIDDLEFGMGSNSLEAFFNSYMQGFRIFEVDFSRTADDVIVAFHDNVEYRIGLDTKISETSYDEFMLHKYHNKYTLLSLAHIVDLMKTYDDMYVMTDFKFDLIDALKHMQGMPDFDADIQQRCIIQVYEADEARVVSRMGFEHIVYTLYRTEDTNEDVLLTLSRYPEIDAVTMHAEDRYTDAFAKDIQAQGKRVYVHTLNDEKIIKLFLERDIGVYTDIYDVAAYKRAEAL